MVLNISHDIIVIGCFWKLHNWCCISFNWLCKRKYNILYVMLCLYSWCV